MSKSKPSRGTAAVDEDAPPRINPDDFVEALLNPRVLEALTKAMSPVTRALEKSLTKRLDTLAATLRTMKEETGRLDAQCKTLAAENVDLKKRVEHSERRVDELVRYSRFRQPHHLRAA